jgi:hypothetical protein
MILERGNQNFSIETIEKVAKLVFLSLGSHLLSHKREFYLFGVCSKVPTHRGLLGIFNYYMIDFSFVGHI